MPLSNQCIAAIITVREREPVSGADEVYFVEYRSAIEIVHYVNSAVIRCQSCGRCDMRMNTRSQGGRCSVQNAAAGTIIPCIRYIQTQGP